MVQCAVPWSTVYRLAAPNGEVRWLKVTATGAYPSAVDEAARTRWAAPHLPVPTVLDAGVEPADAREDSAGAALAWMLTAPLQGLEATRRKHRVDPDGLVARLAEGLRRFHGAPADDCPFDFGVDAALAHVRRRHADGRIDADRDFHEEFAHLTVDDAVAELERLRPVEADTVVCHGDYCLPNVLLDGGRVCGFLDLGELGVADRWWDLAVATWSVTWNLGPGYDDRFFHAYGIDPDPARIHFYRLLYDLVS